MPRCGVGGIGLFANLHPVGGFGNVDVPDSERRTDDSQTQPVAVVYDLGNRCQSDGSAVVKPEQHHIINRPTSRAYCITIRVACVQRRPTRSYQYLID